MPAHHHHAPQHLFLCLRRHSLSVSLSLTSVLFPPDPLCYRPVFSSMSPLAPGAGPLGPKLIPCCFSASAAEELFFWIAQLHYLFSSIFFILSANSGSRANQAYASLNLSNGRAGVPQTGCPLRIVFPVGIPACAPAMAPSSSVQ